MDTNSRRQHLRARSGTFVQTHDASRLSAPLLPPIPGSPSFPPHSYLSSYRSVPFDKTSLRRIWSSKPFRILATTLAILLALSVILGTFLPSHVWTITGGKISKEISHGLGNFLTTTPAAATNKQPGNGRLHLLVFATGEMSDLCELILSAQILGYPTPVLVNYGEKEDQDPWVQHLHQIDRTLGYLQQLESTSEYAEDLVLVVNDFNIWFQLRPDVLIKRFYAANEAADARNVALYGASVVKKHGMEQAIIFGSDKLCRPVDSSRPACWAVPPSTLPETTFGPVGDGERARNPAKWLNSGTAMGSVRDLVHFFNATLNEVHNNYSTNSSQYFMSEIFGRQEYERLLRSPKLLQEAKEKVYYDPEDAVQGSMHRAEPVAVGTQSEYHIGLDYESAMFQTVALWKQYLSWTRANNSWTPPEGSVEENPRKVTIEPDLAKSPPPFFLRGPETDITPKWSGMSLAYNVVTKQHPVLLHFSGTPDEEQFRKYQWKKMWFYPQAEQLRRLPRSHAPLSTEKIGGLLWSNAENGMEEAASQGKPGGAWTDDGGWLGWQPLCGSIAAQLYSDPPKKIATATR